MKNRRGSKVAAIIARRSVKHLSLIRERRRRRRRDRFLEDWEEDCPIETIRSRFLKITRDTPRDLYLDAFPTFFVELFSWIGGGNEKTSRSGELERAIPRSGARTTFAQQWSIDVAYHRRFSSSPPQEVSRK